MKIAIYRNYLRHIGHPEYGFVRDTAYDRVNLIIPDDWLYGYNAAGDPIFIMPDGTKI